MNEACTMKSIKFHKQKADGKGMGWADRSGDGIEERLYYQSLLGVYVHSSLNKLDQKTIIDQWLFTVHHADCHNFFHSYSYKSSISSP